MNLENFTMDKALSIVFAIVATLSFLITAVLYVRSIIRRNSQGNAKTTSPFVGKFFHRIQDTDQN